MPTATEADIRRELDIIEEKLTATGQVLELLLAFRILEAGYAKNLGEAGRIARDPERRRELFADED